MGTESRVFVVDDESAAREALLGLARAKGLQAEGFSSAEEFLAQFDPAVKGCVVVDIRMEGMSGLELLEKLRSPKGSIPVVVITSDADVSLAVKAMQEGAVTFLEKPCRDEELWQAIALALDIEETQFVQRRQFAEVKARLASLTEDELDVFGRLLAGHANKRIAVDLDLGLRTVELRRSNIMKKMQATSMPDLVRLAIVSGFLKTECPT